MKSYAIDFLTNTITVSKKFLAEASHTDTFAYKKMLELRKLGMMLVVENRKKSKDRLSYKRMEAYLSCLAEAERYLNEFATIREAAKGQPNPYRYVYRWFDETFPNRNEIPELDEEYRILLAPAKAV